MAVRVPQLLCCFWSYLNIWELLDSCERKGWGPNESLADGAGPVHGANFKNKSEKHTEPHHLGREGLKGSGSFLWVNVQFIYPLYWSRTRKRHMSTRVCGSTVFNGMKGAEFIFASGELYNSISRTAHVYVSNRPQGAPKNWWCADVKGYGKSREKGGDIAGQISGKRLKVLWSVLTKHRISYPATVQMFRSNHPAAASLSGSTLVMSPKWISAQKAISNPFRSL